MWIVKLSISLQELVPDEPQWMWRHGTLGYDWTICVWGRGLVNSHLQPQNHWHLWVRQLGNWRSSSVKSWMMGTLFSSHRKWLRTVMMKIFFGRERRVCSLSAATWMSFTCEPAAELLWSLSGGAARISCRGTGGTWIHTWVLPCPLTVSTPGL